MFGLTSLGTVHTAIGLAAVICGYAMLFRNGRISATQGAGKAYIALTAITCVTGLGIFQRGGFNIAHALSILTLVTLSAALIASRSRARLAIYVETAGFSLTLFFHMIPGMTETFTRIPVGAPLFSSPEDPNLQKTVGVILLAFLIVIALQVHHIWKTPRSARQTSLPA